MSLASFIEPEAGEDRLKSDEGRLTSEDVEKLLESSTIDSRVEVLDKVSRQFDPAKLSPNEMAIAEQIFRHLVRDSALRIRRALAEALASNPALPRDIALTLAHDVESVATPVLQMTEVLSDADLVDIVHHSEEIWRYLAIARRKEISEPLSTALIETDHSEIAVELLGNPNAAIAEAMVYRLADKVHHDADLADSLARREGLPMPVIERLLHVVTGDLAEKLRGQVAVDQESLDARLREARERTALSLLLMPAGVESSLALVERFQKEGRLEPSLIINALCHGNVDFFEAALARLSGIPVANARLLIYDKGDLGFQAIYGKAGLPGAMLRAVRILFDSVHYALDQEAAPGTPHFSNLVVSRVLEESQAHEIENLSYVLAIIRQPA